MANSLSTSSVISNEFLRRLKNTLAFTMSVRRDLDHLFADKGAKRGVTVNIPGPVYLSGRRGARAEPEGIQDNLIPVTINTQYGQDVSISSQEMALNLRNYGEQVIQPAVDIISNMIEMDGLELSYQAVAQSVGAPGTNPTTNQTYIDAGTILTEQGVPTGSKNRYITLSPAMEGAIRNAQVTQFNPVNDVSEQNREGAMGVAHGFRFGVAQNVARHTVGALGTTPLVNVAGGVAEGATSIAFDGGSNNITGYFKKGDSITFALCNAVNRSSKVNTGRLKQFVLAADVDTNGSGEGTIVLTEAIKSTGPNANVNARPADNAAILTFGHASTYAGLSAAQALAYHKEFCTFVTVDLQIPERGIVMGSRARSADLNLSVRHIRYFDGKEDQMVDRFDVLGGWKVLRPEMAVRIQGA